VLASYSVATWKSQPPRKAIGAFRDENTAYLIMMLRRWWPKKNTFLFDSRSYDSCPRTDPGARL